MWKRILEKENKITLGRDISIDIAKVVKTRFDTSNWQLDRPLPRQKS